MKTRLSFTPAVAALIAIPLFFLLISCATTPATKNPCLKRAAGVDVGSASTKIKAAEIDVCQHKITQVLLDRKVPLLIKESLDSDKKLSSEFIQKTVLTLRTLRDDAIAQSVPVDAIRFVGTQGLREAANSAELTLALEEKGISLRVISQTEEAELGLKSAAIVANQPIEQTAVLDIGGGSFQLSLPGRSPVNGTLASVSFKEWLLKSQKVVKATPNPIAPDLAKKGISYVKSYAEALKRKESLKSVPSEVIGIGGVFGASLARQLKRDSITERDLETAIPLLIKRTDDQIGGPYATTDSSNMLLVRGLMQGFRINKIRILPVTLAEGLLFESGQQRLTN